MRRQALVQERIDELLTELDGGEKESLPEGLSDRVRSRLREDSALSWDAALREIVDTDQTPGGTAPAGLKAGSAAP
jgi:hypothetical protein